MTNASTKETGRRYRDLGSDDGCPIEITDEMVHAGCVALSEHDDFWESREAGVRRIFIAMMRSKKEAYNRVEESAVLEKVQK